MALHSQWIFTSNMYVFHQWRPSQATDTPAASSSLLQLLICLCSILTQFNGTFSCHCDKKYSSKSKCPTTVCCSNKSKCSGYYPGSNTSFYDQMLRSQSWICAVCVSCRKSLLTFSQHHFCSYVRWCSGREIVWKKRCLGRCFRTISSLKDCLDKNESFLRLTLWRCGGEYVLTGKMLLYNSDDSARAGSSGSHKSNFDRACHTGHAHREGCWWQQTKTYVNTVMSPWLGVSCIMKDISI